MAQSRRQIIALTVMQTWSQVTGDYTTTYNAENDARQAIVQANVAAEHAAPTVQAPSPAPSNPQDISDQPDGFGRTTDPEPSQAADEVEARAQLDSFEQWIDSGQAGTSELADTIQATIRADREGGISPLDTRDNIHQTMQDELDAAFAAETQDRTNTDATADTMDTNATDDATNVGTGVADGALASVTHASPEELAQFGELGADERAAELAAMPDGSLRDDYAQMDTWTRREEATATSASDATAEATPHADTPTFADDTPTFTADQPAAASPPSAEPNVDTTT